MSNSVVVYCGNGGDWEWVSESYAIARWLKVNITENFEIFPHQHGDKSIIVFADENDLLKFFLMYQNYSPYLLPDKDSY